MKLANVQKRLAQLENALADLPSPTKNCVGHDLPALIKHLLALAQETMRIEKRAAACGDDGTALAAIREFCRITELIARIGGQIQENTSTNILNVNNLHIDPETAQRVIEIYIRRNKTTTQENP